MTTPHDSAPPGAALARPPLENGDRLSRDEFHRRYRAQPHGFRAELIEGRVYVSSPVSLAHHGTPAAWLAAWLGTYAAARPEVAVGADSTVILDEENEVQPDVVLRIRTEHGGRTRVDEDGFLRGAPELCAEVAASSASYDLHEKRDAYERNGVREYIVWRTFDRAVDWLVLERKRYAPLTVGQDGVYRSRVFPGLWLDPRALIDGDLSRVLDVVRRGIAEELPGPS